MSLSRLNIGRKFLLILCKALLSLAWYLQRFSTGDGGNIRSLFSTSKFLKCNKRVSIFLATVRSL